MGKSTVVFPYNGSRFLFLSSRPVSLSVHHRRPICTVNHGDFRHRQQQQRWQLPFSASLSRSHGSSSFSLFSLGISLSVSASHSAKGKMGKEGF